MSSRASGPFLSGWGGVRAEGRERLSEDLVEITGDAPLTRGLGRSYGDSALPPPGLREVAGSRRADRILDLDERAGRLRAEAGLSLRELVWLLLPRRLFPPVVPGTQYVTLGGMVAADVHGKNHHVAGSVGRHVERMRLRLAGGEIVWCSRTEHPDLFRATIGGMGLTGHILEVEMRLDRIPSSWIVAESDRHADLDTLLAALAEAARSWPFTVAWIDCLKRGRALGRGVLIRGRWAEAAEAPRGAPEPRSGPAVPFQMPSFALSDPSVRVFNSLLFHGHRRRARRRLEHPQKFFFPLDGIRNWNRIYGRKGFTQVQCVLPERERPGAVRRFLELATRNGGSSFLCVLKDCGDEGEGILSFPRRGVSIALDLPVRRGTRALVERLADAVISEGGRLYLAKDAYMRADQLAAMEPRLAEFEAVRRRWDPRRALRSAQSVRLLGDAP